MSTKTPRTDEASGPSSLLVDRDFARQLETELQEAKDQSTSFLKAWVEESKQLAESQAREAVLRDDVKPLVAWMLNHSPACDSDTIKTFLSKHPDMKP